MGTHIHGQSNSTNSSVFDNPFLTASFFRLMAIDTLDSGTVTLNDYRSFLIGVGSMLLEISARYLVNVRTQHN